jgi:hypothetical protein
MSKGAYQVFWTQTAQQDLIKIIAYTTLLMIVKVKPEKLFSH